jgi:hypothetical protein
MCTYVCTYMTSERLITSHLRKVYFLRNSNKQLQTFFCRIKDTNGLTCRIVTLCTQTADLVKSEQCPFHKSNYPHMFSYSYLINKRCNLLASGFYYLRQKPEPIQAWVLGYAHEPNFFYINCKSLNLDPCLLSDA